jgi:hypothetical protein
MGGDVMMELRNMKRLLLAFALCLLSSTSNEQEVPANAVPYGLGPGVTGFGAAAPGTAGNVLTSNGPSSPPGFSPSSGGGGLGTNIISFGADPTGAADSTAAIQAAIDATYNAHNRTIICPDGIYKTSYPIFLDAPGNLRGGAANTWSSSTSYVGINAPANDTFLGFVSDNSQLWYTLHTNNLNHQPHLSPTYWAQYLAWNSATTYTAGRINMLGTITPGSGYVNGTYNNVPLTGGSGSGAQAQIVVAGGVVNSVTISLSGTAYVPTYQDGVFPVPGDVLSASNANLGGSGSGFSVPVRGTFGDVVLYNGIPWMSNKTGNINQVPATITTANVPAPVTAWSPVVSSPSNFSFGLTFQGLSGIGSGENGYGGCVLRATFNNAPIIWSGPGQGMEVKNVEIAGGNIAYRGGQDPNGIGIAIAGGPGGASRTLIENVEVYNLYTCFQTGGNQDELGDSNTFRKINCGNCYLGVFISRSQNDINSAYDASVQCTIGFWAAIGPGIQVYSGNPSAGSAQANTFSISATSAVVAAPVGNLFTYAFSTTIASPDIWVQAVYNSYAVITAHFGVIPLQPTAWNSVTHVMSFSIVPSWGNFYFGQANAVTASDLQAEIQAATTLYATERVTTFWGEGIYAVGQHVENPSACTTLLHAGHGFNGDAGNTIVKTRFNYDPGLPGFNTGSPPQQAMYACQQAFGLIIGDQSGSDVTLQDIHWNNDAGSPILIDWAGEQFTLRIEGLLPFAPNMRTTIEDQTGATGIVWPVAGTRYSHGSGSGDWQFSPFYSVFGANNGTRDFQLRFHGPMAGPTVGFFPAPWTTPRLFPSDLTTLLGALPAIGNYPLLAGGTIYSVVDVDSGPLSSVHVRSAHKFYSYGQNLTTTNVTGLSWSYKGQGFALYVDANTMKYMFSGLGIKLNNGSGPQIYVVTGLYPAYGYVTVQLAVANVQTNGMDGLKTTVFTGTTIIQDPYAILQYGTLTGLTSTVATLPACNAATKGARYFVTDQNTAVAYHGVITGGGAIQQGVTCDGTAWYQN